MAQADFYSFLGVPRNASQAAIKSAHRELIKRYHPDIYSTDGDKARATEKLQAINEAYAVLSNSERRKEYDKKRAGQLKQSRRWQPQPAPRPRAAARSSIRTPPRPRATPRPPKRQYTLPRSPSWLDRRWLSASVGFGLLLILAVYSIDTLPRMMPLWILFEKTVLEPGSPGTEAGADTWKPAGKFASREACAASLKAEVNRDELAGSQAIIDETTGSLAITVRLIATEAPVGNLPQSTKPLDVPLTGSKEQDRALKQSLEKFNKPTFKNNLITQTKHYACRVTQVRAPDSWLARLIKRTGIRS